MLGKYTTQQRTDDTCHTERDPNRSDEQRPRPWGRTERNDHISTTTDTGTTHTRDGPPNDQHGRTRRNTAEQASQLKHKYGHKIHGFQVEVLEDLTPDRLECGNGEEKRRPVPTDIVQG